MGIRGLNKIINKVSPTSIKEKSIYNYTNSIIAIDSSILMYKYRYASNQDSDDSHLYGFFQRVCFYLKRGILPVFVFDGIPPIAKRQVIDKRVSQRHRIEERIKSLKYQIQIKNYSTNIGDIESEITKLNKQITYVTKSHRQECKYLLRLLGIPIIEANGEAEAMCVALQKNKLVDYTFTEDTDALTFGAPMVLRSARKLEKVIEIDLEYLLNEMKLTMDQFIDFCILCGCDYCPTIPKIGPVTSLNLIKEHGTIENILNTLPDKYIIPDGFCYQIARDLFKHEIKLPKYDIFIKPLQYDKLQLFLTNEKNFTQFEFEKIVRRYHNSHNEYNKVINK
jgi:flap endonuclease-1